MNSAAAEGAFACTGVQDICKTWRGPVGITLASHHLEGLGSSQIGTCDSPVSGPVMKWHRHTIQRTASDTSTMPRAGAHQLRVSSVTGYAWGRLIITNWASSHSMETTATGRDHLQPRAHQHRLLV